MLLLLLLLLVAVNVIFRSSIKDVEISISRVTDFQHAGQITTSVAVIRRTPDRAQPVIIQDLIALLTKLMCSQDMRHVVDLQKFLNHISAKGVACSARREGKLVSLRVWIRPYQICHRSFVRYFPESINDLDLVD